MLVKADAPCCRLSQRPPGSAADADEVAQAFKPWLPGILGMAFSTGGRTDQVCGSLAPPCLLFCLRPMPETCLKLPLGQSRDHHPWISFAALVVLKLQSLQGWLLELPACTPVRMLCYTLSREVLASCIPHQRC